LTDRIHTVRREPWRALLALMAFTLATPLVATAQDEEQTPPPELLAAETVFVQQTLIDPKIVSRFRSEISKMDRFEVVASIEEADIVARLSAEVDYTHTVADSGAGSDEIDPNSSGSSAADRPRPTGTVRVLEDIHLTISLPDDTVVWRDSVPAGSMTGNSSKKLAKRLQKRLEEEEQ